MDPRLKTVLIVLAVIAAVVLLLMDGSSYDPSLEDCLPDPQFGGC